MTQNVTGFSCDKDNLRIHKGNYVSVIANSTTGWMPQIHRFMNDCENVSGWHWLKDNSNGISISYFDRGLEITRRFEYDGNSYIKLH
jgi:hypothetical protein